MGRAHPEGRATRRAGLGSGARVKLYGFFKTSIIHDTSSPQGTDFPLPLLAADTGPNASPEFHLKARALRLGANFEWLDPAPKTIITGRLEFDFEGDFTRAANRVGALPLFRGIPSYATHNVRSEFATVFSF